MVNLETIIGIVILITSLISIYFTIKMVFKTCEELSSFLKRSVGILTISLIGLLLYLTSKYINVGVSSEIILLFTLLMITGGFAINRLILDRALGKLYNKNYNKTERR